MADRLALRFVSRCQTVDQFARVFCSHAQPDRLSVPLATEPPPVGTRLRAAVSLANKLGVIEGDAEIGEVVAGAVQLRFLALDPRSRGFLAHLVAHRGLDPAPVPRHLVPMGAAVAGGPTGADPALGTCLIEALIGSGPVPQPLDVNATTRTAAAPPVARAAVPTVDPTRQGGRAARRESAPTVTGVPVMAVTPPGARAPSPRVQAGGGGAVQASLDEGMTVPIAQPRRRSAPVDAVPGLDDLATDIVKALPDPRGDESDPTIDPPPPGPARAMPGAPPAMAPPAMAAHAMMHPTAPPMAGAHPTGPPMAGPSMAGYPPPGAPPPYPLQPGMTPPPPMPGYPPPGMMPPPGHGPPEPMPPQPAVALSPSNSGNAVAGPVAAAAWPMPAQPHGWQPPSAPPRAPAPGGYPTAQLRALDYDGGPGARRPGLPRDRRRPVEMEGDPDLTEIVTVPRSVRRPVARRRWPVIVVSSVIVLVIVVIAIIAGRTSDGETPALDENPAPSGTGSATPPTPAPAIAPAAAAAIPESGSAAVAPPAAAAAPEGDPAAPTITPAAPEVAPAAAPPVAPAGPCTISFTSSPDGAAVLVDGKRLGTTPFKAELPCAKLTATFKRERYRTERKTVEPRPGEQVVSVTLDRPTFEVRVTSKPAGATITVGGTAAGKTPATVSVPGFENVTIEVSKAGFATQAQKVYARADQTLDLKLKRRR